MSSISQAYRESAQEVLDSPFYVDKPLHFPSVLAYKGTVRQLRNDPNIPATYKKLLDGMDNKYYAALYNGSWLAIKDHKYIVCKSVNCGDKGHIHVL